MVSQKWGIQIGLRCDKHAMKGQKTTKTLQESLASRRVVAAGKCHWPDKLPIGLTSPKPKPIRNTTPNPNGRLDQWGVTLATRGTNKRVEMTHLDFHLSTFLKYKG